MDNLKTWLVMNNKEASWIILCDYDCLPIREGWEQEIIKAIDSFGGGFGGKKITNRSGDNSLFVSNALKDGILGRIEKNVSSQNIDLYHCLGALICMKSSCFEDIRGYREEFENIYFEVALPTCAALANHRLISIDLHTNILENVRFRPVYELEEFKKLANNGTYIIHPLKRVIEAIEKL
jgi:hypothetical protein